ncbi:GGDEF domain-containing protein [Vibrio hannami]|uniref:GGDEF domain-containing protein n=1 Tax=Vibrio hannami TaxID=2717094 RepID=UPI002410525B|nr:GGDEF domain-containing protein [Vibrio hannami]MDG3086466.1 GGDEF domain-containing protein [Vibrio hannami]
MSIIRERSRAIATLIITLLLSGFIALYYPSAIPDSTDVVTELAKTIACVYLLFSLEKLREDSTVYKALFISMSLLVVGNAIDFMDEFFEVRGFLDIAEDVVRTLGFIFFMSACIHWVKHHIQKLAHMRHLAEVDSLTGVPNRRTFLKLTEEYFDLNEKNSSHVSLLVIDADNFKNINDTYGHPVGDKVLIEIANTIKLALRKGDYVARLGGEEFVVLLKETDREKAATIAERIRINVQKLNVYNLYKNVKCTVSIGGATSSGHLLSFEELYHRADEAMYKAKSQGRNCYCSYDNT